LFLDDGKSILYTLNEAVNGAFGGPVGVMQMDIAQGEQKALLARNITPAVPCPTHDTACRQSASSSFPDLVLGLAEAERQVIALAGKPLPGPGDTWQAESYILSLISVFPKRDTLLSLGKMDMDGSFDVSIQSLSGERVMVFLKYWRPFSVQMKQWLPDPGPQNTNPHSVYSPDMRYYLAEDDERHQYSLYTVADGKPLAVLPKAAALYQGIWSPDSKRFAVVFQAWETSQRSYHDDLIVYSIR
jgi:hypothetical protein